MSQLSSNYRRLWQGQFVFIDENFIENEIVIWLEIDKFKLIVGFIGKFESNSLGGFSDAIVGVTAKAKAKRHCIFIFILHASLKFYL